MRGHGTVRSLPEAIGGWLFGLTQEAWSRIGYFKKCVARPGRTFKQVRLGRCRIFLNRCALPSIIHQAVHLPIPSVLIPSTGLTLVPLHGPDCCDPVPVPNPTSGLGPTPTSVPAPFPGSVFSGPTPCPACLGANSQPMVLSSSVPSLPVLTMVPPPPDPVCTLSRYMSVERGDGGGDASPAVKKSAGDVPQKL